MWGVPKMKYKYLQMTQVLSQMQHPLRWMSEEEKNWAEELGIVGWTAGLEDKRMGHGLELRGRMFLVWVGQQFWNYSVLELNK